MTARSKNPPISQTAIILVVAAVQFLTPFMLSAVGVALPTIGSEFKATAVHLGLIEMVYMLALALFLLPIGRFADIHGRRKVFVTGASVITLATIILPMTHSIETFIAMRFLQGIGAAMITSTSLAILTSVVPQNRRGRAMGIVVGCIYMGLSAGPTLAGLMTTYLSWRWIFYAALPVEFAALILALVKLKGAEWADAHGEKFDWKGSLLYMMALLGVILGVTHLKEWDTAGCLAGAGVIGIIGFVFVELKSRSPLIRIREIAQNRTFAYSNIATWINYSVSFGVMFFFSIFLQTVKGLSPRDTGILLVLQPLVQAIVSPLAGRLADRYAPDKIATIGMVIGTIALGVSSTVSQTSSLSMIRFVLILLGLGFGLFSSPNTAAVMASITPRDYGMASSLLATMRSSGMLTSMTIITVILSLYLGALPISIATGPAFVSSMQAALLFFAVFSLAGIGFSIGRMPQKV
ncbi:MAG: MFS transporter [Desulfobulbaceae bacterium]|nr:MFS transporter [Desulfobulbaceae bacterium]